MDIWPDYDPEPVISAALRQQMRHPDLQVQADARAHAHALLANHRQAEPLYTCPTCREQVRGKPAEDFGLKSLVRTIAEITGEPSLVEGPGVEWREDPWSAFFGSTDM